MRKQLLLLQSPHPLPLLIVLSVQAVDKELLLLNLVVSLPNLLFLTSRASR